MLFKLLQYELKMGSNNCRKCKKFVLYIIIVIISHTSLSLTQILQDNLSGSSEYTIQVNNKDATTGAPLNCIDCYQAQPDETNQNQTEPAKEHHQSDQDNVLDQTLQNDSSDAARLERVNERIDIGQSDNENAQSNFNAQTQQQQQQLARGLDSNQQSNDSSTFMNKQTRNNNDSYNRTIYSSLVKILYHMKQQLDRSKLRERDDHQERNANNLPNKQEIFSSSAGSSNTGSDSSQLTDEPFNRRLEEVLAAHPLDQDSAPNSQLSPQRSHSEGKGQVNFSPTSFSAHTGSQTSFQPMLASSELSNEPLTNGNFVSGPLTATNHLTASEMITTSQQNSNPSSSQFMLPDQTADNMRDTKKNIDYSSFIRQQQLQQQQQQYHKPLTSMPFLPKLDFKTSKPPSWKLTEKYGQVMSPSFDDQQQTPTALDNKHNQQQYGFTTESSMLEPNYDLPLETTSTNQPTETVQKKQLNKHQFIRNQQQYLSDDPEETYETQPPVVVTSKPRSRSRRSKVTNKQTQNQLHPQVRPVPRHLRATEYLISRDQLVAQPQQDSSSSIPVGGDYEEHHQLHVQAPRSHGDHSGVHLQQVFPMPVQHHQPQQPMLRSQQQQQAVYTLAAAPPGLNLKGYLHGPGGGQSSHLAQTSSSSATHEAPTSASTNIGQRDLVNQPQTIQITAVPNVGMQNQPLVRVNGAALPFNNVLNNGMYGMNGFLDPFGRQVVMVNAERRQVDWSFWFWPILLAVTLPVVLGALFVPVFLKTIVMLIQVLQSLGLLLPLTNALTNQIAKASGVPTQNQIEHIKS